MSTSLLQKWFPKALSPTICNAPMMGVVTPALAVQVTKAGGIGARTSSYLGHGNSGH